MEFKHRISYSSPYVVSPVIFHKDMVSARLSRYILSYPAVPEQIAATDIPPIVSNDLIVVDLTFDTTVSRS